MRKNKIGVLALMLMLTMSVSCSRIGKANDVTDPFATHLERHALLRFAQRGDHDEQQWRRQPAPVDADEQA